MLVVVSAVVVEVVVEVVVVVVVLIAVVTVAVVIVLVTVLVVVLFVVNMSSPPIMLELGPSPKMESGLYLAMMCAFGFAVGAFVYPIRQIDTRL